MKNYSVLIADDEELILWSLRGCLRWEELGYTIVAACKNGLEALQQVRDHRPQIVLADIRMPGMNGLELMHTVSAELPHTQGIFMSGYADFSYAREAIRQEALAYLLKPVDPGELAEALERARRRLEQMDTPPQEQAPAPVCSAKLKGALDYIDAHVRENLSLNLVAGALFISPTYLCQLFRREMNTTFTQYLSERKMAIACELLKVPDATIEGVAQSVGYADYFYFHRVFKKIVGQGPGSYRRQYFGK